MLYDCTKRCTSDHLVFRQELRSQTGFAESSRASDREASPMSLTLRVEVIVPRSPSYPCTIATVFATTTAATIITSYHYRYHCHDHFQTPRGSASRRAARPCTTNRLGYIVYVRCICDGIRCVQQIASISTAQRRTAQHNNAAMRCSTIRHHSTKRTRTHTHTPLLASIALHTTDSRRAPSVGHSTCMTCL